MGDLIEITTWPKLQNIFYRITSSSLVFEIKASGQARIGLAKKPGTKCEYWIFINSDRTCIKREDNNTKKVDTPRLLSATEWRRLWLTWSNGSIQMGRYGESKPFITYENDMADLMNYITFCVSEQSMHPVHWRFDLPPPLERRPKIRTISGGTPQWIEAADQLPDGALIGGFEKETLYVIRAMHRGSMTPGKFVPSEGVGYISWGGDANEKQSMDVLCGFDCIWVPTSEDRIPVGAVEGGYSEDHHERLYVGRAEHKGYLIPGKVQPSHKVCYIPFEGKEVGKKNYEILVTPRSNIRCANRIFVADMNVDSATESEEGDDEWGDHEDVQWHDDHYDSNEEENAL